MTRAISFPVLALALAHVGRSYAVAPIARQADRIDLARPVAAKPTFTDRRKAEKARRKGR